jgi:catechol 2,3-dioxygenase-like lactoylglutathione lyase family enzyme
MRKTLISALSAMLLLILATPAAAQLAAAKEGPIVYGHHHLNVTSVDAHKKFWIDTLGGKPVAVRNDIVAFPNVYVFLRQQASTGGTKGTSVNHIGFEVPDIRATVEKVRAAGYPIITKDETANPEKDGVAFVANQNTSIAFIMAPDNVKVELVENKAATQPIALHHIHFFTPAENVIPMRDWYAKTFNGKPGKRGAFETADLPGVNLTFAASPAAAGPVVGTKGRSLDHIGFEVKGLAAFAKQLETAGTKLDRPVTKVAALNTDITFITDPWGTYVELTDGLAGIK